MSIENGGNGEMIETKAAKATHQRTAKARVDRWILAVAAAVLFGWGLGATQDPIRVGVVDIEQAVFSTDVGKAARDELERKLRDAEAQVAPMVQQYQEAVKELESKKFVLSDTAAREKQLAVMELQNEIQSKQQEIKGQLQIDQERLMNPMREKLNSIINEIGRDEGFSLILQRRAPGVMYSREALDITDKVIAAFNKKG